jgi:aminopeptidase YwaD
MDIQQLRLRVHHHLRHLVADIGARPPGSPANSRATEHLCSTLDAAALPVRTHPFETRWWQPGGAVLLVDGEAHGAPPAPFARPVTVTGTVARLSCAEGEVAPGSVVVVDPELTPHPVMPKAFPFFQPPEHTALVRRLEGLRPAAVIAVGEQPIFEDPDLSFPNVTVGPALAARLREGEQVTLRLEGEVHAGVGETVAACTAAGGPRLVLSAHVDSKVTTPGAFDNAGSVAVLLAWAELADAARSTPVELVFFNGEDHFDACGEQAWLAATDLAEIRADINLDGVGVVGRGTSVTGLAATPELSAALEAFADQRHGWQVVDPWFESDHAIFAMQGIPAVAVTSVGVHDLLQDVAHTPRDTIEMVDIDTLTDIAASLDALVAATAGACGR